MNRITRDFIKKVMDELIEKGEIVEVCRFIEGKLDLSNQRDFYLGYLIGILMSAGSHSITFISILETIDYEKTSIVLGRSAISNEDKLELREMIDERRSKILERVEREVHK